MANLNKVQLIGNLTRDPELRHTPRGTAITEISIAINRTWKDDSGNKQEEVTFVEVTFWGRTAETIQTHLAKGAPIYVEGRLQLDSWDDKDTGKKRTKLRVVGENFQFLASGQKRSNDNPPHSYTDDRLDREPPVSSRTTATQEQDLDNPF